MILRNLISALELIINKKELQHSGCNPLRLYLDKKIPNSEYQKSNVCQILS